ncbi:anti-FecI sigma factor, FecR [Flammeovirgaceae bacterium 311]|nr:anti-FecI sigma factor, FecR [Flammeovirgaceae bacterium 311]
MQSKDYNKYNVEDFLLDDQFREWVIRPDAAKHIELRNWITSNPSKSGIIEAARDIILSIEMGEAKKYEAKTEEMWEKLSQQLDTEEAKQLPVYRIETSKHQIHSFKRQPLYSAAAVFIGLLLITVAYLVYNNLYSHVTYTTAYGELKHIMLPDSSEVTINANSTLSYSADWSDEKAREVWIEGEAFFSVRKKPNARNAKFIVHSNNIGVEVLGTKFNVNNRRGHTRVVLNSGKVRLNLEEAGSEDYIMKPGELAEISDDGREVTKEMVKPENFTSWRHQQLVFDGSTIEEISQVLEDNYGYQVHIKNKELLSRKFQGTFPSDNPKILLKAIAESFGLVVTVNNNEIILESKP